MSKDARWNGKQMRRSEFRTDLLFHCADMHGVVGRIPDFDSGETWVIIHEGLHETGEVKRAHEH